MNLRNLNTATKIMSGFFLMVIVAAVIGIAGILSIDKVSEASKSMYELNTKPMAPLLHVDAAVQRIRINYRDHIIEKDPLKQLEHENLIKELQKTIDTALPEIEHSLKAEETKKAFAEMKAALNHFEPFIGRILAYSKEGKVEEAIHAMRNPEAVKAAIGVDETINKLVQLKTDLAKKKAEENIETDHTAKVEVWTFIGLGILLGIVAAMVIVKSIVTPIGACMEAANKIAAGDMNVALDTQAKDEPGRLSAAMQKMVETIQTLISEMSRMSREHDAGDIDVQVNTTLFQGAYKQVAQGVNDMVGGHIMVKKKAMACVAEFGKGNFDAELEKFPGKKAFINETIEKVRANIKNFIADMATMSHQHDLGDIDATVPEDKYAGAFHVMAKGVNDMVHGHIAVKKKAMACIAEFGRGNFDAELEKFPGKKAFINETIEKVRGNIKGFISDMNFMATQHDLGDIDVMVPEDKYEGAFHVMAKGVNDMVKGHLTVKKKAMACIADFGKGNFDAELEKFPGKKAFINETIEKLRENLKKFNEQLHMLIKAAVDGKLDQRANDTLFVGDWQKIVQGVNSVLDAVIGPLNDSAAVLKTAANKDLTIRITKEYRGQFNEMKENINRLMDTLQQALKEVQNNAETLAGSSDGLTNVSKQLAKGAEDSVSQTTQVASTTEQMSTNINTMASAAEEMSVNANSVASAAEQMSQNMVAVSAAVEEMSSSINMIAQDAERAREISKQATASSKEANNTMAKLGEAAKEIGNVTEVIKRIAEQTNLLALNATIEAASAGEAGKGFAVVANEIKELANQSARAADDIAKRIQGVQVNTGNAVKVIDEVSGIIGRINESVSNIAQAVDQQTRTANDISSNVGQATNGARNISASITEVAKGAADVSRNSSEAARGAREVSSNIADVRKAAQSANQGSQQVNVSAESLSKMAGGLQGMVARFRL